MKKVVSFVICFQILYGLSAQERFLRKAHSALNENDFKKAFSMIDIYEKKEEITAASQFMRFLVLHALGKSIEELDQAWELLESAISGYGSLSEKEQEEWCSDIDFCSKKFSFHRKEADLKLFETYKLYENIDTISIFIKKYPGSKWIKHAKLFRCSLAFKKAKLLNTESGYLTFIKSYYGFPQTDSAKPYLWKAAFKEAEAKNTIEAFKRFINNYPKSPQLEEAKNNIWMLAWIATIAGNKKSDYLSFIANYPDASQTGIAKEKVEQFEWKETLDSTSIEAYERFTQSYPHSVYFAKADSILQDLKKKKKLEELLKEAGEKVEKLYFTRAEELLLSLDEQIPATAIRAKDSLLARIQYLRPLLQRTLGKYSCTRNGVEVIIALGVNASDSSLYCLLKAFRKGVEINSMKSGGNFKFGTAEGKLHIEWETAGFNDTLSNPSIGFQKNEPVIKLSDGVVYRKISSDYESEIESTQKH